MAVARCLSTPRSPCCRSSSSCCSNGSGSAAGCSGRAGSGSRWRSSTFFHVLVDGWLTKLSAPIVIYDEDQITGVRIPWDIPVEDYLFGFSMIVLTLLFWLRAGRGEQQHTDDVEARR